MLIELFPFVILNNAMAFVYAYFFSDFLRFDMSLLLLTVAIRGVSNKHCLLSLFFIIIKYATYLFCCLYTVLCQERGRSFCHQSLVDIVCIIILDDN